MDAIAHALFLSCQLLWHPTAEVGEVPRQELQVEVEGQELDLQEVVVEVVLHHLEVEELHA